MLFNFNHAEWIFEENGKLYFKQQQLFQIHRLMLVMLGVTGIKLRYETPKDLKSFLNMAMTVDSNSVQTQLRSALSTLPENWRRLQNTK
jgi:hypothetical protein